MRSPSCESDLSFDRALAGDLPEADERRVRAHLAGCAMCAARWAEIKARRAAFDAARSALDLDRRTGAAPWWRRRWIGPGTALAAAVGVVLLLVWPGGGEPVRAPATRSKGGEVFELFIRHGASIRKAGAAEVVHPDDQLQFVYSSQSPGYAAVLSRDGAGVVSVYFPDAGTTAWAAAPGRDQQLPRSTILDDTPGRELVIALFCSSAIDLEPLRRELAAGRRPAPPGCAAQTIVLDKQAAQ
jgi:hypothetical protein